MSNRHYLNELVEYLHMSINSFEKEAGLGQGTLGKIVNSLEERALSPKSIKKILDKYPNINPQWLLTGKGPMLKDADNDNAPLPLELQVTEGKKKDIKLLGKHVPLRLKPDEYAEAFGDWPGLPMYNAPVTASFVETYRDESVYKPQYYLHDPRFRDCDFGAIITGDSMHSEIRHGDFIACKEVKDTRFIVYGDIYYVVATNGLETCKYVNVDPEDRNNLLLVARSEKISPSPLPKEMIHKLYKVRGIVRGY